MLEAKYRVYDSAVLLATQEMAALEKHFAKRSST
jgi:hypothetical protein